MPSSFGMMSPVGHILAHSYSTELSAALTLDHRPHAPPPALLVAIGMMPGRVFLGESDVLRAD